MAEDKSVRIDKFLWAIRLFKTRSLASAACRMGRILINGIEAKPSRVVEGNEMLTLKRPPVTFSFRIKKCIEYRLSAKLVPDFLEDLTPESERIKLKINLSGPAGLRKKGSGRPTKKERRIIDKWQGDLSN